MMKKISRKIICICLILAFSATSFSALPVCASTVTHSDANRGGWEYNYWNGITLDPIAEAFGYRELTLTISSDMVFKGFMSNLTKEELDTLCQEALDYIGETAETVKKGKDAYNELVKAYKDMYETACRQFGISAIDAGIRQSLLSSFPSGVAPFGTAATVPLDLYEWVTEKDNIAAVSAIGSLVNINGTIIVGVENGINAGLAFGTVATILTTIVISLARVLSFRSMVTRVMELEQQMYAYADFLDILQRKVAKYNGSKQISFPDAKAIQTFDFTGKQFTETWWLHMTLMITTPAIGVNTDFRKYYEGAYKIYIAYDVAGIHDPLYQMVDTQLTEIATASGIHSIQTLTDPGIKLAVRTLNGVARAQTYGAYYTVEPIQEGDDKDVTISDITIHISQWNDIDDSRYESDFVYHADGQYFYLNHINRHNYNPNVSLPDEDMPDPWEYYSDIWLRGDDAASGWVLTSP